MPIKQIYKCEPCSFEYEHLYFGKTFDNVPPCPSCQSFLTREMPVLSEDAFYECWQSEGGCGTKFCVEVESSKSAPLKYVCPICGAEATKKIEGFSILHGKSMESSVDVKIGRSAEEKWGKIYDRKSIRDSIRKEAGGNQALTQQVVGLNQGRVVAEARPIKAHLKSVTVPQNTVNKGEKV